MAETARMASDERVWDPLVRLTHWTIAAAVLFNGLIIEDESLAHIWIGYVAFAMLILRLIWGMIGTEEARFTSFPPSPRAAFAHIADLLAGRRRHHRSHNPLGALMVYALWGTLLVVSVTGVMLESAPFPVAEASSNGDDAHEEEGEDGEGKEEVIEEIHETAANILLVLAALHVAGVALESRFSGVNLVRAMVTGVRTRRETG
jgi:cytochrome b